MKYKINCERILEILKKYDKRIRMSKNSYIIDKYNHTVIILGNEIITQIKNNKINSNDDISKNLIIEKLHPHFKECFEKLEE